MNTNTADKIIQYIQLHKQVRPYDLVRYLNFSEVAVHKQLRKLVDKGILEKLGKPPLVYYRLPVNSIVIDVKVASEIRNKIDETYLYITPLGSLSYGMQGFIQWAVGINESNHINTLAQEYTKIRENADSFYTKQGWIDATDSKIKTTFADDVVSKLLYADFNSLPKFGKTKLGQLILYAKQSQNKELTDKVIEIVKPLIERVIKKYKIDTVVFIPPSIPRAFQFMTEFAEKLNLPLKRLNLVKISPGSVIVPQKSLSRLEERIENAKQTIFIDTHKVLSTIGNVLIIDDAVGSGSTIHEVARKLRDLNRGIDTIVGFSPVGSMKGFEVIMEV